MPDDRPIGLFDTGVGGLLIFERIRRRFPEESFICLADASFLGRADRSPTRVTQAWSRRTARRLAEVHRCKALVVACNTAYIAAHDYFSSYSGIPIAGPVEHAASAAVGATQNGVIGVVATGYTVKSHVYQDVLKKLDPSLSVVEEACPEWVQWVERAHEDPDAWSEEYKAYVLELHLKPLRAAGCDTIILGCTHFPALRNTISEAYALPVTMVDGAKGIEKWMEALFAEGMIARSGPGAGNYTYLVTSELERFQSLGRRLLKDELFTPLLDTGWPSQGGEPVTPEVEITNPK